MHFFVVCEPTHISLRPLELALSYRIVGEVLSSQVTAPPPLCSSLAFESQLRTPLPLFREDSFRIRAKTKLGHVLFHVPRVLLFESVDDGSSASRKSSPRERG